MTEQFRKGDRVRVTIDDSDKDGKTGTITDVGVDRIGPSYKVYLDNSGPFSARHDDVKSLNSDSDE